MPEYLVKYEIDIEAESKLDAAKQAYECLRNMKFKPALNVTDQDGNTELIDLEDYDCGELASDTDSREQLFSDIDGFYAQLDDSGTDEYDEEV